VTAKKPVWKTGGCITYRHIETPQGWIGVRKESWGWVVTGVDDGGWRDFDSFAFERHGPKALDLAEKCAEQIYEAQVKALMSKWMESENA
jgi:hypothetical protein